MSSSASRAARRGRKPQNGGDTNAASFGVSVAVSGTTIVVGAPPQGCRPGVVFVFEEDEDGAWGEVARLSGEPFSGSALTDNFGASVSIDADTVIAGAHTPSASPFGSNKRRWSMSFRAVAAG